MLIGILSLVLGNVASILAARSLLRLCPSGQPHVDVVLFLILRLAVLSGAVLVAGLSSILNRYALGLAATAATGLFLAFSANRVMPKIRFPAWAWPIWLALTVLCLRVLAQVWFLAPYNHDALSYHLPKIAEWVRAGSFTHEMGLDTHVSLPAGYELIETWWVLFLEHDVLIEMAGVEFLVLAFASVYALATHLGLAPTGACLAGLFYVLTPGLQLQATGGLNDGAVASCVTATFALVATRAPLGPSALAAGLGMGIKGTFLYAVPGIVLLEVLARKQSRQSSGPQAAKFGLITCALWIGLFWYLRNVAWFGNPIYPLGSQGLVGGTGQERIQLGLSFESGVRNVASLFARVINDVRLPQSPLLPGAAGWGLVCVLLGGIGLVIGLRRNHALGTLVLALAASFVSVLFLVRHDPWNFRFVLFFPVLFSLGIAYLPWSKLPIQIALILAGGWMVWSSTFPAEVRPEGMLHLARLGWGERSWARVVGPDLPPGPVAFYVNELVSRRGEAYLLYGPDFSREVVYLRPWKGEGILEVMDRRNVRVLCVSRTSALPDSLVERAAEAGFLRPLGPRLYERDSP